MPHGDGGGAAGGAQTRRKARKKSRSLVGVGAQASPDQPLAPPREGFQSGGARDMTALTAAAAAAAAAGCPLCRKGTSGFECARA